MTDVPEKRNPFPPLDDGTPPEQGWLWRVINRIMSWLVTAGKKWG